VAHVGVEASATVCLSRHTSTTRAGRPVSTLSSGCGSGRSGAGAVAHIGLEARMPFLSSTSVQGNPPGRGWAAAAAAQARERLRTSELRRASRSFSYSRTSERARKSCLSKYLRVVKHCAL